MLCDVRMGSEVVSALSRTLIMSRKLLYILLTSVPQLYGSSSTSVCALAPYHVSSEVVLLYTWPLLWGCEANIDRQTPASKTLARIARTRV
jgi:hypothetical protein